MMDLASAKPDGYFKKITKDLLGPSAKTLDGFWSIADLNVFKPFAETGGFRSDAKYNRFEPKFKTG